MIEGTFPDRDLARGSPPQPRQQNGAMSSWRGLGHALAEPARYGALVAGALPVLAFPAPNLEFLAWFALVPGLLLMRGAPTAREAAVRAWWSGAGFVMAAHYWLAPNIGPALLLVAIVLGACWAGVGVSAWALLRPPMTSRRSLAALVVVPSFWLLVEWIRSWQALGGPWALLGASQWQHPAILALASVGGVWLLSFALVAANTGMVILVRAPRAAIRALGAAAALIAAGAGPLVFALTPPVRPAGQVTVALVQPGYERHPSPLGTASQRLTARLGPLHPDLIVWGESSIGDDLRFHHALLDQLRRLAAADGAPILVDQDSYAPAGKSKVAVLVNAGGIVASYAKTRLVPFGEYIPFRQQLGWLTKISKAAPSNMIPGDGARVMTATLPGGRPLKLGVLICFEAAFPDMSRADARHGAQLIVYQTSDSTFQGSWAPAQHASLSAVRAAETGRPAVQAALTGVTAAFDAQGRQLAWLGTAQRGVALVRLDLVPAADFTLFDHLGDTVPWAAIAISVLAALVALNRTHSPQRLVGIMVDGNRRPVSPVSISEAIDRDRLPDSPVAGEQDNDMRAGGPAHRTDKSQ
jgi:apolipoprotein N-acyltransferase